MKMMFLPPPRAHGLLVAATVVLIFAQLIAPAENFLVAGTKMSFFLGPQQEDDVSTLPPPGGGPGSGANLHPPAYLPFYPTPTPTVLAPHQQHMLSQQQLQQNQRQQLAEEQQELLLPRENRTAASTSTTIIPSAGPTPLQILFQNVANYETNRCPHCPELQKYHIEKVQKVIYGRPQNQEDALAGLVGDENHYPYVFDPDNIVQHAVNTKAAEINAELQDLVGPRENVPPEEEEDTPPARWWGSSRSSSSSRRAADGTLPNSFFTSLTQHLGFSDDKTRRLAAPFQKGRTVARPGNAPRPNFIDEADRNSPAIQRFTFADLSYNEKAQQNPYLRKLAIDCDGLDPASEAYFFHGTGLSFHEEDEDEDNYHERHIPPYDHDAKRQPLPPQPPHYTYIGRSSPIFQVRGKERSSTSTTSKSGFAAASKKSGGVKFNKWSTGRLRNILKNGLQRPGTRKNDGNGRGKKGKNGGQLYGDGIYLANQLHKAAQYSKWELPVRAAENMSIQVPAAKQSPTGEWSDIVKGRWNVIFVVKLTLPPKDIANLELERARKGLRTPGNIIPEAGARSPQRQRPPVKRRWGKSVDQVLYGVPLARHTRGNFLQNPQWIPDYHTQIVDLPYPDGIGSGPGEDHHPSNASTDWSGRLFSWAQDGQKKLDDTEDMYGTGEQFRIRHVGGKKLDPRGTQLHTEFVVHDTTLLEIAYVLVFDVPNQRSPLSDVLSQMYLATQLPGEDQEGRDVEAQEQQDSYDMRTLRSTEGSTSLAADGIPSSPTSTNSCCSCTAGEAAQVTHRKRPCRSYVQRLGTLTERDLQRFPCCDRASGSSWPEFCCKDPATTSVGLTVANLCCCCCCCCKVSDCCAKQSAQCLRCLAVPAAAVKGNVSVKAIGCLFLRIFCCPCKNVRKGCSDDPSTCCNGEDSPCELVPRENQDAMMDETAKTSFWCTCGIENLAMLCAHIGAELFCGALGKLTLGQSPLASTRAHPGATLEPFHVGDRLFGASCCGDHARQRIAGFLSSIVPHGLDCSSGAGGGVLHSGTSAASTASAAGQAAAHHAAAGAAATTTSQSCIASHLAQATLATSYHLLAWHCFVQAFLQAATSVASGEIRAYQLGLETPFEMPEDMDTQPGPHVRLVDC
ncbi:unnamed protein product [Amoebophrya sp. A120]|nr:unnamed protein product [Amoebophrya sp. A120]|eukprot:GSA120T00025630001.1